MALIVINSLNENFNEVFINTDLVINCDIPDGVVIAVINGNMTVNGNVLYGASIGLSVNNPFQYNNQNPGSCGLESSTTLCSSANSKDPEVLFSTTSLRVIKVNYKLTVNGTIKQGANVVLQEANLIANFIENMEDSCLFLGSKSIIIIKNRKTSPSYT